MSKRRQHIPSPEGELPDPVGGDLTPYVIFTQLKAGGPFIYAGWLDAVDDAMALAFAREHYGQDQVCTAIRAFPRRAVHGDGDEQATVGGAEPYLVFHQKRPGDNYMSAGEIEGTDPADAFAKASAAAPDLRVWVAAKSEAVDTDPDELIWRHSDQTYRLARGYSKVVREKWEAIRTRPDHEAYAAEDLEETF